jgi:hypothetical protein
MPYAAEYILPLKWADIGAVAELSGYLEHLVRWVDVTVVDGSAGPFFERHARAFPAGVRHVRPDPELLRRGGNGKVLGVLTGLALARHERVIVADDDVRYRRPDLQRMLGLLDGADLVRPQNYFAPLPWHARWDTGRALLNRALASDYPGTLAIRRSIVVAAGGYSPDALFENLELIRTVRAAGGVEVRADDLFVRRLPCSARHFARQRVRQAYDSFAQPVRLAVELSVLPTVLLARPTGRQLAVIALTVVVLAEVGRRRRGGRTVFHPAAALWAPVWLLERAVCSWLAVVCRVRGGVGYAGGRMKLAAHSERSLRIRWADGGHLGPPPRSPGSDSTFPPPDGVGDSKYTDGSRRSR